jgi:hypothetical protein
MRFRKFPMRFGGVRPAAVGEVLQFEAGEEILTEISAKYRPGQAETLLREAALEPVHTHRRAAPVRAVPGSDVEDSTPRSPRGGGAAVPPGSFRSRSPPRPGQSSRAVS